MRKLVYVWTRINRNKVICFICGGNITNKPKVISYHNYPYHYWDTDKGDWNKELPTILNGAMCSDCAELDLEIAHKNAMLPVAGTIPVSRG